MQIQAIQNEIVFSSQSLIDTGPLMGHLLCEGCWRGVDFDQMHIILNDVSEPPPVADVLFGIPPDAVSAVMCLVRSLRMMH